MSLTKIDCETEHQLFASARLDKALEGFAGDGGFSQARGKSVQRYFTILPSISDDCLPESEKALAKMDLPGGLENGCRATRVLNDDFGHVRFRYVSAIVKDYELKPPSANRKRRLRVNGHFNFGSVVSIGWLVTNYGMVSWPLLFKRPSRRDRVFPICCRPGLESRPAGPKRRRLGDLRCGIRSLRFGARTPPRAQSRPLPL
jgi:hypothetical protein